MAARVLIASLALLLLGARGIPADPTMVPFKQRIGFASGATGGAGKPTCTVASLSDEPTATDTLREICEGRNTCCTAQNGCSVDFDGLEGQILTTANLYCVQDNLTIDGSTAGPDGVEIVGCSFSISGSNQIFEHLTFSGADIPTVCNQDAITIIPRLRQEDVALSYIPPVMYDEDREIHRLYLRNVTARWGWDEVLSIAAPYGGSVRDVTIERSIIAQGMEGEVDSRKCSLLSHDVGNISFVNNLFTGCDSRNPLVSGGYQDGSAGTQPVTTPINIQMHGNLIHNVSEPAAIQLVSADNVLRMDFTSNGILAGDASTPTSGQFSGVSERRGIVARLANEGSVSLYMNDNWAVPSAYGSKGRRLKDCDLLTTSFSTYTEPCAEQFLADLNSVQAGLPFTLATQPHFQVPTGLSWRDVADLALRGGIGAGRRRPHPPDAWQTALVTQVATNPTAATLADDRTPPAITIDGGVTTLNFVGAAGASSPATQDVVIENASGVDTVYWTVADDISSNDWCDTIEADGPDDGSGSIAPGGSDTITVSVDQTPGVDLAQGEYRCFITMTPRRADGQPYGYPKGVQVIFNVGPSGTDVTPVIEAFSFSGSGYCYFADASTVPCNGVTATANLIAGTEADGGINWRCDGCDGTAHNCGAVTDCNNACFETLLGASNSLAAVATPDAMWAPSGSTKWVNLCAYDSDGDDSPVVSRQLTVRNQTIVGTATLDRTEDELSQASGIDVTVTYGGTCPWPTTGADIAGDCGACATSSGFATGVSNDTDGTQVFTDACDCSDLAGPLPDTETITATISGCGTAPSIEAEVDFVTQEDPDTDPSTFFISAVVVDSAGAVDPGGPEPYTVANIRIYPSGTVFDKPGVQLLRDVECDITSDGTYDYEFDADCTKSGQPSDCDDQDGAPPNYVSFLVRDPEWNSAPAARSNLADGTYTITCRALADPADEGLVTTDTTTLVVDNTATAIGDLTCDQTEMVFTATYGQGDSSIIPPTATRQLTTANGTQVNFGARTIGASGSWLAVTPTTAGVTPNTYTFDPTLGSLTENTAGYTTTVTWANSDNPGDTCVVPVRLVVNPAVHTTGGIEARCSSLNADADPGTVCLASETLNYSLAPTGLHFWADSPTSFPPYSAGDGSWTNLNPLTATSYGVSGYRFSATALYDGQSAGRVIQSVAGSTVGLPQVGSVLAAQLGSEFEITNDVVNFSGGTVCSRSYYLYPATATCGLFTGGQQPALKMPRGQCHGCDSSYLPSGGTNTDAFWQRSTTDTLGCSIGAANDGSAGSVWGSGGTLSLVSGDAITMSQARGKWIRYEICWDHNSRSGADANKLYTRQRVTLIETGEYQDKGRLSSSANSAARWDGEIVKLAFGETPGLTAYVTHGMAASKYPADETFWIGPSSEVEPQPVSANTYFVDPTGGADPNNNRSGTSPANAWQNLPGTRLANNAGFWGDGTWGSITSGNKLPCGSTIYLKGGATQNAAQGGAWLIDPTYYSSCTAASPITIKVATASEWSGSAGDFTLDGTGITPTYGVYDTHAALINVTSLNGIHIKGASSTQRINVQDSTGNTLTTHTTARTTQMSDFLVEYHEHLNSSDGINLGPLNNYKISNTIVHDITNSGGIQTGLNIDHVQSNGAFVDVEVYNTGSATPSTNDDGIFLVGGRSIWCVRCTSHDNNQRGVNVGIIFDPFTEPYRYRFRGLVSYDNGAVCAQDCLGNGYGGSGDDSTSNIRATIVGYRSYRNQQGSAWSYGSLGTEVWNATLYDSNLNVSSPKGDIMYDRGGWNTYWINSYQRASRADSGFGSSGLATGVAWNLTPVIRDSCWRHFSSTTETLGTEGFSGTYASPHSAFSGNGNMVGTACPAASTAFTTIHATDYTLSDFTPQAAGGLVDQGRFLMLTASAKSNSTALDVVGNGGSSDPRDFFIERNSYLGAGYNSDGTENNDRKVQIEGCGVRKVESMTATTITLDTACTWSAGAGVSLPWVGAAPDIGAVERP